MPKSKVRKNKVSKSSSSSSLGERIWGVLWKYLTTQFILMVLVGFATWGILNLLNVGYPILLAVITGVLSGVPGFGMTFSTVITAVVAILDKVNMWPNSPPWLEALIILVIFFVFNKIVDLVIAPIFLGKATKVNPLVVILLVTAGTIFFGIPGAILAMPFYLVVKVIVEDFSSR